MKYKLDYAAVVPLLTAILSAHRKSNEL